MFHFGTYRNETYEDVTEETPDYYFWGSQERKPSKCVQHHLEWVTEHCVVDPVRSTLHTTEGQKFKKSFRQDGWKQAATCVRQPLIEFTARTAVSTFMSGASRSGHSSKTKLGAICSGVAQRGSTFHMVVNVSQGRSKRINPQFPSSVASVLAAASRRRVESSPD